MPALVVIIDNTNGPARRLEFERSPIRIGRGPDNEVRLDMAFVSQHHAEIRFTDDGASYIDLGSTNGTFREGTRVPAHTPLPVAGTLRIHIGSVQITIEQGPITRSVEVAPELSSDRPAFSATPAPTASASATSDERRDQQHDDRIAAAPPAAALPVVSPPSIMMARPDLSRDESTPPPGFPAGFEPPGFSAALPSRFDPPDLGQPAAPARPRGLDLPTIFPTLPREAPPADPDPPRPVAGEIHVTTPARQPRPHASPRPPAAEPPQDDQQSQRAPRAQRAQVAPSRSAPAPAPVPQRTPSAAVSARGDEATDLADLRELATALCDDLMKLRAAMEAFGRETGIRTFNQSDRSRVHELRDGAELLRYLMPASARTARRSELRALFSDLVHHQLAMMGAIVEGARATLARVDPEKFAKSGRRRFLDSGRWDEYVEHFHEVQQDDQAIQEAVFGAEFAEAYAASRSK